MTVTDLDRAVDFVTRVLDFALGSTVEVTGMDGERRQGVHGTRRRVARSELGDETVELAAHRALHGRPISPDGNVLEAIHVRWHPSVVRVPGAPLGFSAATMLRDPDGHTLRVITH